MKLSILTILATAALSTQAQAYECGLKGLNETVCLKVEKYCPTTISSSDLNTIKEKQAIEANGVKFDVEGKPFTTTAEGDVSLFSGRFSATKSTSPKVVCMYTDKSGDQVGKDTKAFVTLGTKITKEVDQKVAELEKEARKVAMDANAQQNPAEKNPNMTASEQPAKDQPAEEKNIQQVSAPDAAPQGEQNPAEHGATVEGASAPAAPEAGKAQDANVQKISSYDTMQAPMGNVPAVGGKPVDGVMPATTQSSTGTGEAGKSGEGYASSTGTGSTGTTSNPSEVATGTPATSTTGTGETGKPAEGVTPATTTEDANKKIEGFQGSQGGSVAGNSATGTGTTGGSH